MPWRCGSGWEPKRTLPTCGSRRDSLRHALNSEERDLQLSPWREHYNFRRPHGSLGYAPPISRASPVGTTS